MEGNIQTKRVKLFGYKLLSSSVGEFDKFAPKVFELTPQCTSRYCDHILQDCLNAVGARKTTDFPDFQFQTSESISPNAGTR